MKITLVRHGETEENFLKKVQGRRNIVMNENGRRQCIKLKDKLKNKKFDICYMSPLARCVETAIILIGDRVKTVPDKRLIERGMGELEGKDFGTYDFKKFWEYELNDSSFGIEPVKDIFDRVEEFYQMLLEKHSDQSVLIVTHGAPYRALRYLISKRELKGDLYDGAIGNCCCEEFEVK